MVWVLHSSWSRPGPGFGPVLMVVLILPWSSSCPGSDPAMVLVLVLVRLLSFPLLVCCGPCPGLALVLILPWSWSDPGPVLALSLSFSGLDPVLVLIVPWP